MKLNGIFAFVCNSLESQLVVGGAGGEISSARSLREGRDLPTSSQTPSAGTRNNDMGGSSPSWLDQVPIFH